MKTFYRNIFFSGFVIAAFLTETNICKAQQDSTLHPADSAALHQHITIKDSIRKKIYSPRSAAIRSAILPGLGQIYNKKYWKLPIVYGALGTTAGIFLYNLKYYRYTRFAYDAKYTASLPPPFNDSTNYRKIRPDLLPLSTESLRFYRDEFRKNIDYSALVFIILWGINVVDATVDAHLKGFDVSPDLTLKIKPCYMPVGNTGGLSLVLSFKNKPAR